MVDATEIGVATMAAFALLLFVLPLDPKGQAVWRKTERFYASMRKAIEILRFIGFTSVAVSFIIFMGANTNFVITACDPRPDAHSGLIVCNNDFPNTSYRRATVIGFFFVVGGMYALINWIENVCDYPFAENDDKLTAFYGNGWLWLVFIWDTIATVATITIPVYTAIYFQDKNPWWVAVETLMWIASVLALINWGLRLAQYVRATRCTSDEKEAAASAESWMPLKLVAKSYEDGNTDKPYPAGWWTDASTSNKYSAQYLSGKKK